jgi:DNA-binding PadR family transcriptional regulator
MASKRKTQFAILGLLTWKPMSGYDVKKAVDIGLSHFWSENYGQIYPTLDQLVKEGLATKKSKRQSGKRQRFVYTITRKGQKVFRDWIAEPTESPFVRNELMLKLFLSSRLPDSTSIRLIREHQMQQQTLLDEYQRSEVLLRNALHKGEYPEELQDVLATARSNETFLRPQDRMLSWKGDNSRAST